jgi:hypothetical protein
MNASSTATLPPAPFFHEDSGAVRFWVLDDAQQFVGATVSKEALHYRFQSGLAGSDALASYLLHQGEIDAAVRRRIASGSIEPVMLRERDMAQVPVA